MTTQPAGEHHTGTLNLAGQGNTPQASPITDEAIQAACGGWATTPHYGTANGLRDAMRAALEAAYPAIRQHVAQQIMERLIAEGGTERAKAIVREVGRGEHPEPAEGHAPIGILSFDIGLFIRCSCGDNPSPHHWLEAHWPGDKAEGQRLADEMYAREIGGGQ